MPSRQAAVDDGHEDAAVLDAGDGLGERVGLERQDDEGVDLVDRDQVLDVVGLLAGAAGGVDDDLQVRVGGLQAGLGLGRPTSSRRRSSRAWRPGSRRR
jgi:hypothetical protein